MKRYMVFILTCILLITMLSGCIPTQEAAVTTIPTQSPTVQPTDPMPTNPTDPQPTEPVEPKPSEPAEPEPSEPIEPEPSEPITLSPNGAVMIARDVPEEIFLEMKEYRSWENSGYVQYIPYWPIFAVYENRYYVTFPVRLMDGEVTRSEVVNGLEFWYTTFSSIRVYETGNSYSLTEAFALGILNGEQVQEIYDRHQMFMAYARENKSYFILDEEFKDPQMDYFICGSFVCNL